MIGFVFCQLFGGLLSALLGAKLSPYTSGARDGERSRATEASLAPKKIIKNQKSNEDMRREYLKLGEDGREKEREKHGCICIYLIVVLHFPTEEYIKEIQK
jgi:hypothetical protein